MTGGCLCGGVRYTVSGPLAPVVACHCAQCRRTSGHYAAATTAPREALRIEGEVRWYCSSVTARRGFCGTCGSSLFWDAGGERLSIMAGTLDAPTGLEMSGHIYVADKSDYYRIFDGLPYSQAGRTEETG